MSRGVSIKLTMVFVAVMAVALSACGGENESSGETRTIQHAMGETEVPVNPERVVVLDSGELDSAMTLGVTPVGAVEAIPGTAATL